MKKERVNEIWGVLFLLLGLFTLTSLIFFHPEDISFYTSHPAVPTHNHTGVMGAYLSFGLFLTFGLSAYLIPGLFLLWAACFFLQQVPEKKMFKFVGLVIALFSTATLIAISLEPNLRLEKGGVVGYLVGSHLLRYFGYLGSFILATACLLLSLLLATDFLIYPMIRNVMNRMQKVSGGFWRNLEPIREWLDEHLHRELEDEDEERGETKRGSKAGGEAVSLKAVRVPTLPEIPLKVKKYRPDLASDALNEEENSAQDEKSSKNHSKENKENKEAKRRASEQMAASALRAAAAQNQSEEETFEGVVGAKVTHEGDYQFPSLDLLNRPQPGAASNDNLQENSKILESTLAEFGIEVKVVEVEQGPVITRYELLPAPGVKVNSIAALSDDIALALKAASVRLIIPIPGKSAVGIEVPNSVSSLVSLRELLETATFRSKKMTLPLVLGKDTSGKPLIADLTGMPHILIAGTTGSGKTVCVNSIITSLLYHCTPDQLKFIMVDPKMVELAVYNKIPHMLSPVVTDVKKASHTLNWVVNEMEKRYKLLAAVGVRNIQTFNDRPVSEETIEQTQNIESENVIPARLPYIVVIIDELADLMMVAQDKVETAISRLAQLSRAVGIHLILATQRPSVDVITGVIKANFPARVSFKVASKVDSRTVLDGNGADKLIGRGDMLFMQPGDAKPIRGQAPLVTDKEINNVTDFVSRQAAPEYHSEITQAQENKTTGNVMEKDELYDEAVAVVLETGQASTSNLQRRLRLGYTRAARIIDQMEAEGIIGSSQGAKPREIYISRESSQVGEEA